MRPERGQYFAGIDGLRGIAVLSVVLFHLDAAWVPAGFAGVDVFFVISGFVVSQSMAGIAAGGIGRFLVAFYARRLTRIAPALIVCLLATTLLACLFIPNGWLSEHNRRAGIAAFFGLSNMVLAQSADDYFAPRTDFNPFTHTWSLGVEEQFYLLMPILFYAARSRPRALAGVVAALAVVSLVAAAWWMRASPVLAFYLLPARFWELGCGVLLFLGMPRWRRVLASRTFAVEAIGFGGLGALGLSFWFADGARFPFPWALPTVAGSAGLIVAAVAGPQALVQRALSASPLVAVGKLSYSLYLWHWPVVVLMRWTTGLETPVQKGVALVLAGLLAVASYVLVERPALRAWAPQAAPRYRAALAGAAALLLGAASASGVFLAQPAISMSVANRSADWQLHRTRDPAEGSLPCQVATTSRTVNGVSAVVFTPQGCERHGSLYVAGDSHAGALSVLLRVYVQWSGREVVLVSQGGCPVLELTRRLGRENGACREHIAALFAMLDQELKPGDVLLLPSLRLARSSQVWGERAQARPQRVPEDVLAEAASRVARWEQRGAKVVFLAPTPVFGSAPFRCADWFNKDNPACSPEAVTSRAEVEGLRAPILAAMRTIGEQTGAAVWDPIEQLCDAQCRAVRDGRPLFFDGDHLSGYGNLLLVPSFRKFMCASGFDPAAACRTSADP